MIGDQKTVYVREEGYKFYRRVYVYNTLGRIRPFYKLTLKDIVKWYAPKYIIVEQGGSQDSHEREGIRILVVSRKLRIFFPLMYPIRVIVDLITEIKKPKFVY